MRKILKTLLLIIFQILSGVAVPQDACFGTVSKKFITFCLCFRTNEYKKENKKIYNLVFWETRTYRKYSAACR